jgi:hypothetical protein
MPFCARLCRKIKAILQNMAKTAMLSVEKLPMHGLKDDFLITFPMKEISLNRQSNITNAQLFNCWNRRKAI